MARIYMPKIGIEEIEKLKADKPFVLKAQVPDRASFVGVCAVPSLVDIMGFSGGGGPPAFAYLIDPDETLLRTHLLMTIMPEQPFGKPGDYAGVVFRALGVVQVMGMLLMACEFYGDSESVSMLTPEEHIRLAEKRLLEAGANIFETHPYAVPEVMKAAVLHKLAQARNAGGRHTG
jgi:hypothetical protein